MACTKVVGAVRDHKFVPYKSLREVFNLMYASSHLALLVLTSTARSNPDLFYDIR